MVKSKIIDVMFFNLSPSEFVDIERVCGTKYTHLFASKTEVYYWVDSLIFGGRYFRTWNILFHEFENGFTTRIGDVVLVESKMVVELLNEVVGHD